MRIISTSSWVLKSDELWFILEEPMSEKHSKRASKHSTEKENYRNVNILIDLSRTIRGPLTYQHSKRVSNFLFRKIR